MKCSVGDIFSLILDKVAVFMLTLIEDFLNNNPPYETLIKVTNSIADGFKWLKDNIGLDIGSRDGSWDWMRLQPLCFEYTGYKGHELKDCDTYLEMFSHVHGCDPRFESRVWKQCYYARIDAICGKEDASRKKEYYALFDKPTQSLKDDFKAILGDSFEEENPVLEKTFEAFDSASKNTAAQEICVKKATRQRAMDLDEMILACLFYHIEKFCPATSGEDNKVETFLNEVEWQLPKVVWDWSLSPPPPPPREFGNYDDLIADDPSGWQFVREKLMTFWPRLDYVASQSRGSIVGVAESNDRRGWGGVYYVSRFSTTTAFLATAHFKDQNSLSARMWQARYTGMFRFACRAFMAFMSTPENAAMGSSQSPNFNRNAFPNPADFSGKYDRNWLNMAAILFSQSYFKETGVEWHPDGLRFWDQNCISPANDFSPVQRSTVTRDPMVYGHKDFMGHEVPLTDFGPLFTYGSLRQLRDRGAGRLTQTDEGGVTGRFKAGGVDPERFPEDYTLHEFELTSNFFGHDRLRRGGERNLDFFNKQVICNPTYKYTIEDAIGDPYIGSNTIDGHDGVYDYEVRGNGRRLQSDVAVEAAAEDEAHNSSRRRAFFASNPLGGVISNPVAAMESMMGDMTGQYKALRGGTEDDQILTNNGGIYEAQVIFQSALNIRDAQGNLVDRFTGQIAQSEKARVDTDLHVTESEMGPTATKRFRYQGCGVGIESNGCKKRGTSYEQHSLWQWVYVTSSDEEDITPGWHRLLHFKGFSWKDCTYNREQPCNSKLNGRSPGFDADKAAMNAFHKRMKALYQSELGVVLEDIEAEKAAREAAQENVEQELLCRTSPVACTAVDAVNQITGNNVIDGAINSFGGAFGRRLFQLPNGTTTKRIVVDEGGSSDAYDEWGDPVGGENTTINRTEWKWPVLNRTATRLAARARLKTAMKPRPLNISTEARRKLREGWENSLISSDGVYDPDALLAMLKPDGDFGYVVNSTWNIDPNELLKQLYLERSKILLIFETPVVQAFLPASDERERGIYLNYRTGKDALFRSRCSDLLSQYFPDEVKCCVNAPTDQPACTPIKWYTRWPTSCNQQHLELADGKDSTLSEQYLSRLRGALPPPSPPPSPSPPPPPSPPAPPPPPLPPIALSLDDGKKLAKRIERRFCDSVRTKQPQPLVRTRTPDIPLLFRTGLPALGAIAVQPARDRPATGLCTRRRLLATATADHRTHLVARSAAAAQAAAPAPARARGGARHVPVAQPRGPVHLLHWRPRRRLGHAVGRRAQRHGPHQRGAEGPQRGVRLDHQQRPRLRLLGGVLRSARQPQRCAAAVPHGRRAGAVHLWRAPLRHRGREHGGAVDGARPARRPAHRP